MFYVLFFLFPIPVVGTVVKYRSTYYPRSTKEQAAFPPETPDIAESTPPLSTVDSKDLAVSRNYLADLEAGRDTRLSDDASALGAQNPPPSFWGIFMSVWRHDHFEGLLQGYFPHLLLSMATMRFYISPTFLPFVDGEYVILPFNILYIYYLIASYRLIVSPHKFRLAEPKTMFRLTFTEYERAHPFKLLRYCGLVLPFFFNLVFTKYCYLPLYEGNMRRMDNPFYTPPGEEGLWYKYLTQPNWYSWMHVGIHVGVIIAATLIWAPVHVILTRLAVQPVHGPPNTEPLEERDVGKLVDMGIIAAPSYLHLTTEQRSYHGFRDCFKRIVSEEGWGVLYRCWWLTMLGFWVPVLG